MSAMSLGQECITQGFVLNMQVRCCLCVGLPHQCLEDDMANHIYGILQKLWLSSQWRQPQDGGSVQKPSSLWGSIEMCLQDKENLKSNKCREEVHKLMKRAFEDIRFDPWLNLVCRDDRQRFCEGFVPVCDLLLEAF